MKDNILIIGGAGFIGSNAADHFLRTGNRVMLFDNMSRRGVKQNCAWLQSVWSKDLAIIKGNIVHDRRKLADAVSTADAVIHLAGQTAVTTSVADPYDDFLNNATGTIHVLEAIRASSHKPPLIFSSTNKVYGKMDSYGVRLTKEGYRYRNLPYGISETAPVDFYSPYGCSKGASDQYVRDYARIYGLKTVVFRQSCIYGPHQFGIEDQGWVAWFTIAAAFGKDITIYGDGHQSRDVLYVGDLAELYERALGTMSKASGNIYNVGGGADNVLSLRQTLSILEDRMGRKIPVRFGDWRPGDQKVFISDIRSVKKDLGWKPKTSVIRGVSSLIEWVRDNPKQFNFLRS